MSLVLVSEAAPLLKRCKGCGLLLPHSEYYADVTRGHRPLGQCKQCKSKAAIDWRAKKLEEEPDYYEKYKDSHQPLHVVMFRRVKRSAKSRGLPFDLPLEWFEARVKAGVCELTNERFHFSPEHFHPLKPSVDRIDSSLGYIPGNVRMIFLMLNIAKNAMSDAEFRELFPRLADAMRAHAA